MANQQRFKLALSVAALGFCLAGAAWAGPAKLGSKAAGPEVVVHPLTPEERLQEADYLAYEPLMEGMGPYSKMDSDKVEGRAKELCECGSKTDSPFVDWAHAAALSLSTLDSEAEQDRDRASRWAGYWTLLSRSAKDRFESNQEGRAVSIADNALCSYRPDEASKRECVWASA